MSRFFGFIMLSRKSLSYKRGNYVASRSLSPREGTSTDTMGKVLPFIINLTFKERQTLKKNDFSRIPFLEENLMLGTELLMLGTELFPINKGNQGLSLRKRFCFYLSEILHSTLKVFSDCGTSNRVFE